MWALIKTTLYRKPRTKTVIRGTALYTTLYYMDQNVGLYARQVHGRSNGNVIPRATSCY
jgi:hypothetical protein